MLKGSKALAAAAGVALLASAGAVSAQDYGGGGFYLKGFGGFTFPSSEDSNLRASGNTVGRVDLDYDTGYTLGVAGGYMVTPNVAVEVEYAYRRADFDGTVRAFGTRDRGSDHTTSNSFMVNALYVFDGMGATGQVKPYLGAGLGGAELDVAGTSTDTLWAYQLIGGVGYEVAPNVTLMAEGRWYGTDDGAVSDDGVRFKTKMQTFDLLFGISYAF